jgi:hypothetical protein
MARHPDVDHLPYLQFNKKEGKERAEEQVGDWQEVAGPDLMCMLLEERGPASLEEDRGRPWRIYFGRFVLRCEGLA